MSIKYESTSFIVLEFDVLEQMLYWKSKYEECYRQLQNLMIQDLGIILCESENMCN